jgi:hypothetical protein
MRLAGDSSEVTQKDEQHRFAQQRMQLEGHSIGPNEGQILDDLTDLDWHGGFRFCAATSRKGKQQLTLSARFGWWKF